MCVLIFSRLYLSNGRAIGMVVVCLSSVCLSVCLFVKDGKRVGLTRKFLHD